MVHRPLHSLLLTGALSAFLLLSTGASAQNAPPEPTGAAAAFEFDKASSPAHQAAKNALLAKARSGNIRLIVGLRAETAPEHTLGSSAQAAQRQRIAGAQQSFIQEIQRQGRVLKRFETLPYVVVEGNEALLQVLLGLQTIASIQEDRLHAPSLAESVPLVGGTKAWAAGATGAGQTVAIVDTGVDSTHPFLSNKVVAEACYSTIEAGTSSLCPNGQSEQTGTGAGRECSFDGCGHGTHVAGIAAGKGTNFSGVAKDAKIIAVQVFTAFHGGCSPSPCLSAYTSDIMKGLEYVYGQRSAHKIAAVNLSLGGEAYSSHCDSDALKTVIDNLRGAGIATVVASGNQGFRDGISAPSCISTAISVGATTKGDAVASYSNSANILTMLAPGSAINSSVPQGGFALYDGTSMAAPHVAGAIAVLRSAHPTATVDAIKTALVASGKPIVDSRNYITKPRLDANAALVRLGSGGTGACFNATNPTHVAAGRAYVSNLWYARAKGSNQSMGLNNSYTRTKLRQTRADYYVVDNTCP